MSRMASFRVGVIATANAVLLLLLLKIRDASAFAPAFVPPCHIPSGCNRIPSLPRGATSKVVGSDDSRLRLRLSGQDIIETGVSFDTFAPQFLWVLMIAAPNSELTRRVMGPLTPILGLALVHMGIVLLAASQEGALSQILIFKEVFDPSFSQLSGMQKLFSYPNFVAEEWPHVLVWDLFVGRMIWLDGLHRDINTRVALSFCNFIGPPGLLIHAITCLISGKGLPPMGYEGEDT